MPFDGTMIAGVVGELREKILNGRIDKITQPEPDEIVLAVRGRGENLRLLLTANASSPRLCLTEQAKASPQDAPLFCMVMRKHIGGGRIVGIEQPGFERIVDLHIESPNEMGDRTQKRLIIEIMGKHSNIALLGANGAILGAAKHITHEKSSVREVLPGIIYERPPSGGKTDPREINRSDFIEVINNEAMRQAKIQQAFSMAFNGIGPLTACEICARAGIDPAGYAGALTPVQTKSLFDKLAEILAIAGEPQKTYYIYRDEKNIPFDLTAFDYKIHLRSRRETYDSVSEAVEVFYRARDDEYRLAQKTSGLRRTVAAQNERCMKKRMLLKQSIADSQDRERLRENGELLTAYMHQIKTGADEFIAEDFNNPGEFVSIPLDPILSPSENAQAYFKRYNKKKRAYAALLEQSKQNEDEIDYLESVSAALQNELDESDIAEIRAELAEGGYVKRNRGDSDKKRTGKKSKPL
ncbi:MAG: NFACT family protein, partial [Defluviitaleaceae bacterium]|nr:NFACT family protein [Defluviitaleaceae bacterium]